MSVTVAIHVNLFGCIVGVYVSKVVKMGFTNQKIVPERIHSVRAIAKIFQLQLKANRSIAVNKAFEQPLDSQVQSQHTEEATPPVTPLAKQTKRSLLQSPDASDKTAAMKRGKGSL